MITVHHLNNSRSQRILWMLEELGLEYQIKHYQRDSETMLAPPELVAIHPLGKSPVLQDDNEYYAESGAIIDYLSHKYGQGTLDISRDNPAYKDYSYWLHFSEGSLMPPLVMNLVFSRVKSTPMPFFVKPIANKIADNVMDGFVSPNIKRNIAFIEDYLGKNEWFAGASLSGADVQMIFPLEASISRGLINADKHPATIAYVDRIHQLTTYQQALEKGGEYSFA